MSAHMAGDCSAGRLDAVAVIGIPVVAVRTASALCAFGIHIEAAAGTLSGALRKGRGTQGLLVRHQQVMCLFALLSSSAGTARMAC